MRRPSTTPSIATRNNELSGLRPKHGQAVSLRNVYVPVITRGGDVETEKKDKPRKSRDKLGMPGAERPEHQLLQTLAANKSLYLSGPPGSGKTTFCRWLTLAVCTGDPRVVDDLNNPSVWVTLPAGKYRIGDDDKTSYDWGTPLDAQEFLLEQPLQLSKYPVTNGQYARFVDADGYGERKYWSADGWKWCQGEQRTEPDYWRDPKWNGTTQPVVGVTWWEAEAFCRWADCRLPTEREWEAAARGPQGRAYPWGDKWRKDICNTNEAGCNVTTPVGIFPRSAAACGAHDMAGNVWEWCADTFDSARANDPDAGRVLRGGSWDNDPRNCRSAIRNLDLPDNRGDFIGFRVART